MADHSLALSITIGAAFQAAWSKTFGQAGKSLHELGKSVRETEKRFKAAKAVSEYRDKLEMLRAKQQQMGRSSARLERGIADLERRYREAKRAARGYGLSIADITREEHRLGRELALTQQRLKTRQDYLRHRQARSELRGRVMGALGSVWAASNIVGKAISLEDAQVRLGTVINAQDTARALALSRQHALNYAATHLTDATETLNIEYALNSAGLKADAARVGSEIVAEVATVTNGMPEQVGEVVATTFNNLGASLEGSVKERLSRIGDLLTKTQFKFQIRDFGQLGESMKYAAPALAQYNIELAQGVTLIGELNSAGLQGGMAGTALTATLAKLSGAADKFGFALARNAKGGLDVIGALRNMSNAIGGFDNLSQDTADELQKTFGIEGVRALIAFGKRLNQLEKDYQDVAEGSRGLRSRAYQAFLKSSSGQMRLLGNNLRIVGTVLAGTVLPPINWLVGKLASAARWVGELTQEFPVLGKVISGVAAGMGGLFVGSVAWRYLGTLVGDARNAVKLFGGTLKVVGGALFQVGRVALPVVATGLRVLGAALVANPVGAIVTGIALAAGLVITHWDKVKSFFLTIWDKVKPVWEKFAGWVLKLWDKISAPFKAVGGLLGKAWNATKGAVGKAWAATTAWFGGNETTAGKPGKLAKAGALAATVAAAPAVAAPIAPVTIPEPVVRTPKIGAVTLPEPVVRTPKVGAVTLPEPVVRTPQVGAVTVPEPVVRTPKIGAVTLPEPVVRTPKVGAVTLPEPVVRTPKVGAVTLPEPVVRTPQVGAVTIPESSPLGAHIPASEPPAQTRQTVVNNTDNSTVTITVHQQPGEDAEALARRVAEILREQRRVERTGALYDLEDG